jgi:hypothetical protein
MKNREEGDQKRVEKKTSQALGFYSRDHEILARIGPNRGGSFKA